MKTIWYLQDVETRGADFFIWSDSEAHIQEELTETLNHYYAASPDLFEIGSAQVSDDYQGEPLN